MTEFEKLVARVMSTAHIGAITPTSVVDKPTPKKKQHRIVKRVQNMTKEQAELLMLLLEGKVATICIKGEAYAYRKSDTGYVIRSLVDGEPEHTVFKDLSACSCADSRFRGNICKHILALKEVIG